MKKYVKFRRWTLERFTRSVKNMAAKLGVRLRLAGMRDAHEDKFTVAYTVRWLEK